MDKAVDKDLTDRLRRLDRLSQLLDNAFAIPGTRFRIGLDGIIGLIPGIGDAAGAVLSIYVILQAARLGLPVSTLLRMLGNVAIETVVGAVPIVGDIFDIVWKANIRNMALLRGHRPSAIAKARTPRYVSQLGSLRFFQEPKGENAHSKGDPEAKGAPRG